MTVRLLAPAQQELDEAVDWYAQQAPGLGEAFLVEVVKTISLIETYPQGWRPLGTDTRQCRLHRFPYSIVYALDGEDIVVVAVAHQHRKPLYWKER